MSTTESRHITLVEVLIAGGLIVACAVPTIYFARQRSFRNTCIANLRQIEGAKDQCTPSFAGTNIFVFTWDQLSFYIKDMSNKCICPSSRGKTTNIPNDCYSIEPLGNYSICKVRGAKGGHTLLSNR